MNTNDVIKNKPKILTYVLQSAEQHYNNLSFMYGGLLQKSARKISTSFFTIFKWIEGILQD